MTDLLDPSTVPDPCDGVPAPGFEDTAILDRPRPEWVCGECPQCGSDLVSGCAVGADGEVRLYQMCWSSLRPDPTCDYRQAV